MSAVTEMTERFHLSDRLERTAWEGRAPVLIAKNVEVYIEPDVAFWYVWAGKRTKMLDIDAGPRGSMAQVLVLGPQTWDMVRGYGPALARLLQDVGDMGGLNYIPLDGVYREAAEKYQSDAALDKVAAHDGIRVLEDRAQRLLEQRINADMADSAARSALFREAGEVSTVLSSLEERLARVRTTVELARDSAYRM